MHYIDPVYGMFDLTNPVILELLASPEFHRLRDIDSGGYPYPFFLQGKPHSRFDHSIGVYLLLKRYGASLEEQVAGLIHDVSHSAFSHAIDYVLDGGKGALQDHQDNVFDAFVRRSGIPAIIARHGLNVDFILDDRNFPLKETDLLDLCADRLDYSLRHAVLRFGRDAEREFLEHLHVDGKRWVFDSAVSARARSLIIFGK